jgi:long-chain acyl-CoA synthetase
VEEEAAVALTIPDLVAERIAAHGGETVLREKDRGIWKTTTWAQLGMRVRDIRQGLHAIDFGNGDVACVLVETRPEWVYIDLAVLGSGGISGGLHPDDDTELLCQALRDSDCRVLFVENEEQLDKALMMRERCPALQRIVIIDMKGLRDFADPMCESLQSLTARGAAGDDAGLDATTITADQPAILLFQGGRGRTLTHGDALHLIANGRSLLSLRAGDERLALLPMCQVMERVLGLYLSLDARVVTNYLENPDTAIENLQELQPTVLATDPKIWQLLHSRVSEAAANATRLQRMLYRWAIAAGARGGPVALLARACVLYAVKREVGLGRLRVAYIGGARLAADIERWAASLGITVQPIDGQATRGIALDERYHALMQEAYGT